MTRPQYASAVLLMVALGWAAAACARPPGRGGTGNESVISTRAPGDVMTAGNRVRIEAEVDGDVAAAGRSVDIDAPVHGYVMSAGRAVTIGSAVGNDAWLAGDSVTVGGSVRNNALLAGRVVTLTRSARVGQDVRAAGNDVRSEAYVAHDLMITAARAVIGGEVGGTVHVAAGAVTILPGTVVHGDLVVRSPDAPAVPASAQILGATRHEATAGRSAWGSWPFFWLMAFLSLLILGLVLLATFPAWTLRVTETMRVRTVSSFVYGLFLIVVTPLVIGVLLITVVGIPLALVVLALYVMGVLLSGVFVSYRLGQWLLERRHRALRSRWSALALGALIVSLAVSVPAVGWIAAVLVMLAGAGALALERRDARGPLPAAAA